MSITIATSLKSHRGIPCRRHPDKRVALRLAKMCPHRYDYVAPSVPGGTGTLIVKEAK